MTLAELVRIIESHAPGSLIPRDWLVDHLRDLEAPEVDDLAHLTVDEAGEILGRSPSTVRDYARRGLLPGSYRQRGREWRIPHSAIQAFQRAEAEEERLDRRRVVLRDSDLSAWRAEFSDPDGP